MQDNKIKNNEQVFDIEEFIKKAKAFHKDKNRAEKIQKKEGYLESLCPTLYDKICFKAVYDELFSEDTLTSEILKKKIEEIINNTDEEIEVFNIRSLDEFDLLYKKFKIFAKTAIKRLQQIELMQIERMQKNARRIEIDDNSRKNKEKFEENDKLIRETKNLESLKTSELPHTYLSGYGMHGKLMHKGLNFSPFSFLSIPPFNPHHERINYQLDHRNHDLGRPRRQIGKSFDELSQEMKESIKHDRIHAREREKNINNMIKDHRLEERIREKGKQRALKRDLEPPQMHK